MTHSLDVTAIGEGQLRFSTRRGVRLERATSLRVGVSGTEGNVLCLLSRLGRRTGLVTALPDSPVGRIVSNEYRAAGVDLSRVIWRAKGRLALYYLESASPPFPSRVYFDRKASCFAELTSRDVDWDYLAAARVFHASGITAAVSPTSLDLVREGIQRARGSGQTVSFDVNYRSRLWDAETASRALVPLLERSDVIVCPRRDATLLFGIAPTDPSDAAPALANRFGARAVIVTDGARDVHLAYGDRRYGLVPRSTAILDRVGAGDSLVGGFLHGYLAGDLEFGLRLGVTAAALALTQESDQISVTEQELVELAQVEAFPDIAR